MSAQKFQAIPIAEFIDLIQPLKRSSDLIEVMLTNGELLFGAIFKYWRMGHLIPLFEWDGKTFSLAFNSSKGKGSGNIEVINIPIDAIANVSKLSLAEHQHLDVTSYPNPLATIIHDHNVDIARKNGFESFGIG